LSVVLYCGGLGAVLSSPLASHMMVTMGGPKTVLCGAISLCGTLLLIGMAPRASLLMASVVLLGLSGGCYTVGANALASRYESTRGRSVMARLHAWACGGSLIGTVLGSVAATAHLKPLEHFLLVALPVAGLLLACYQILEPDSCTRNATARRFAMPNARLASLGVLAFCTAMAHNGIADWSGLFLKEQFNVAAGFAPLALSIFSAAMLLGRMFGDRLKAAHGARLILSFGAGLSAAGLLLAVLAPSPNLALIGFASSGIGLSFAYPFIFSAVGKEGTMALAGVATMSNLGSLAGPLILGALSDYLGIAYSIGFIGVLSVIMGVVASRSILLK
jgi:MFS family permease